MQGKKYLFSVVVQFGFQIHRFAMNVCLKARDSEANR